MTPAGKVYCAACSRLRRAILYKAATRHGCNKVALGHHADDLVETLLLSVFYSGQLKSMPPKLRSRAGTHEVIRPLVYVQEHDLRELAALNEYPILPCNLCGSQQTQRQFIKELLEQLHGRSHHIKGNILNALGNVKPSHLMDKALSPYLAGVGAGDAAALPRGEHEDDEDDACATPASAPVSRLPLVS